VAWEQFYPDMGKPQIAFNAEVVGYVAPQRTWVGLTNEETFEIFGTYIGDPDFNHDQLICDALRIEAKLKEKNT
jgi:hypothetical protein